MRKRPTANPLSRVLFFWTLALSCVSITSYVIFSSLGYRIQIADSVMTLIYTGSIKYKSEPQDVTITIDGKEPGTQRLNFINGSYHITGVRHGLHTVRMEAEGYKPWEKTVRVRSGITTNFWNATLIRDNYEARRHETVIDAVQPYFSADNALVAYPQHSSDTTLYIPVVEIASQTVLKTIALDDFSFAASAYENIEWSPSQDALIIPVEAVSASRVVDERGENPRLKDYVIAPIESELAHTVRLSELIPRPAQISDEASTSLATTPEQIQISHVRWHPGENDTLLFIADGALYRVPFAHAADAVQEYAVEIAQNVVAYDFADDGLYIIDESGRLLRDRSRALTTEPVELTTFSAIGTSGRVIAYDAERVIYINDDSGHLMIYNAIDDERVISRLLDVDVRAAHFSDDGKKLLYHTDYAASVYFVRAWTAQPLRDADTTKTALTTEQSLASVLWTSDYEHFIAVVDDDLHFVEIDHRGGFVQTKFYERQIAGASVVMDKGEHILYFLDRRDGDEYASLYSFVFPYEKTGLLPL